MDDLKVEGERMMPFVLRQLTLDDEPGAFVADFATLDEARLYKRGLGKKYALFHHRRRMTNDWMKPVSGK